MSARLPIAPVIPDVASTEDPLFVKNAISKRNKASFLLIVEISDTK